MRWSQDSNPGCGGPSPLTRITAVVTLFSLDAAYHPLPTARVIHVYEIVCPLFSEPSSGSHLTQEKPGAHSGLQAHMIKPCSSSAGTSCFLPIPLSSPPATLGLLALSPALNMLVFLPGHSPQSPYLGSFSSQRNSLHKENKTKPIFVAPLPKDSLTPFPGLFSP